MRSNPKTLIALFGLLVVVFGLSTSSLRSNQEMPLQAEKTEVEVDSTQGWQSSGVYVEQGMTVILEVTDGSWTNWKGQTVYNGGEGTIYICANNMAPDKCVEPLPSFPSDILITRIGDTKSAVGKGTTIIAEQSGELYLRINDGDDGLADNDGKLKVGISISVRSTAIEPETPGDALSIQFDPPAQLCCSNWPQLHLGQDIVLTAHLTNTNDTTWSGNLLLALSGSAVPDPRGAVALGTTPVWDHTEPVSLAPGASLTRHFVVPYENYQSVGTGEYFVNMQALGQRAYAWATISGAATLDLQVPASSHVGEPVIVTAIVSNPTDATIHDVQLTDPTTGLDPQDIGDLAPNTSKIITWTFVPRSKTAGLHTIIPAVQTSDSGITLGYAEFMLLAPAKLQLNSVDISERIEVGQSFQIVTTLRNLGSDPINNITVTFTPDTPALFMLDEPAGTVVKTLQAYGWKTLIWHATALQAGELNAHIEASSGNLYANRSFAALIAHRSFPTPIASGHAVDLVIDNVGDNTKQGEVLKQIAIRIGTNYAWAVYTVVVQNEGNLANTLEVSIESVESDSGAWASFGEFGLDDHQVVAQTIILYPGESAQFMLTLRTVDDEATALVYVKSQSDLSQWDQMKVRVIRNDAAAQ